MTYLKKLQLWILGGLIATLLLDYWSHDLKQLYAIIATYAMSSVYAFICIKKLKFSERFTLLSAVILSAVVMIVCLYFLPQFIL
ncbi:hypothetical protein HCG65_02210 [Streptococcus anginosus]|uniref:hypothetical protein n=1 Tax=Streptococcus anginosus TaxID=1328 RepID=UPI001C8CEE1B|nr:hypothetical protein [Streptococcus anginosus]MBX9075362.1 hypothetical protein [Streptococcus anginosus]